MRVERDFFGEVKVPRQAYYGVHSCRAASNFDLARAPMHLELITGLLVVKKAAAMANRDAGLLERGLARAIIEACDEALAGGFSQHFIVDALQGGAGTSANMNVNEVIANRANELLGGQKGSYCPVHPLDQVNMSQSTNDVFPTALRIGAIKLLRRVSAAFAALQEACQAKEQEFAGVIKLGRTQLQDAVPVTLGQEFSAFAQAFGRDRWRLYKAEERLRVVPIGGTAVGTGLNAGTRYIHLVTDYLQDLTGFGLARAENTLELTQNADVFAEVSGLLKAAAVNLLKVCSDLRLMASGPKGGLAEISLPELQAGSSIMPGKVNPVIPEAVTQASFQVLANDLAVSLAAQAGQLELNAFLPLIAHNLLQSLELLERSAKALRAKCISGIKANKDRCLAMAENSSGLLSALTPVLGYEQASRLAREAAAGEKSVRQVLAEQGLLDMPEVANILSPSKLIVPGKTAKNQEGYR